MAPPRRISDRHEPLSDAQLADLAHRADEEAHPDRVQVVAVAAEDLARLVNEVRRLRPANLRTADVIREDTRTIRRLRSDSWLLNAAREVAEREDVLASPDDVVDIMRKHREKADRR
jgi:hypothetical protein